MRATVANQYLTHPFRTVSEGEFCELRSALKDSLERPERGVEGSTQGGVLGALIRRLTQRPLPRVPSCSRPEDGNSPWQRKSRALLVEPGQDKHAPTCVYLLFPLHRLQDLIGAVEGVFA